MRQGLATKGRLLVLAFLAAFVLVGLATWLTWRVEDRRFEENRRASVRSLLGDARLSLDSALSARLAFLRAIAAFAAHDPQVTAGEFSVFAATLTEGVPGIRSLQLARNGVVSHVYPEADNAGILGLDLRQALPPEQRSGLVAVLEAGRITLTGPVPLLQGSEGLLVRAPVFLPGSAPKPTRLWGVATLIVDARSFFAEANLEKSGALHLAIRDKDGQDAAVRMVYGDPAVWEGRPLTVSMAVPGGEWVLGATPRAGWTRLPLRPSLLAAGGCVWLAVGTALFLFLSWPARLSRAVAAATAALDTAKVSLERTVATRTAELTEANAALRLGEARYRAFIDATRDMAFLKDAQLRHLVANKDLAAFFGKTLPEVLGKTDYELMPAALAARCHESDVAARDGGDAVLLLETLGERTFEVRKFPVPLAEGETGVGGYIRDISDRLAAEQALRHSETELHALYDNAPIGIFTSTPAGRYLKANIHLARMYGYADVATFLDSIASIRDQTYVDPAEREAMLAALASQDRLINYEVRRRTRSGEGIWVSLSIRAVRDAAGALRQLEGFCSDITPRKAAEEALANRERQLRIIFDNSPLGLVFFDEAGVVRNCNARMLALLGLPADRIIGQALADRLPPPVREALQRALGGEVATVEGPYPCRASGTTCHVRSVFNPVENGHAPSAVIASVEDISALREKDASLRLLWAAVEQSPTSVVITDLQGTIEYVNPHFSILTGYTPEEAKGQTPRVLKSDAHPDSFYREMWTTLLAGQVWRGELCNRKKNGDLYWENSSISPVRDDAGAITHFVAVKEDITGKKRREDRLRQLMGEFEAIFNASSVGIVHLAQDEHVVRANPRFGELFHLAPETLAGRTLTDIHARSGRLESLRRELLDAVAAGRSVHAEERLRTATGEAFWCSIYGRRIDPDSPASGSIWIFDDVSARKELENVREDVDRIMRHDLKAPLNSIVNLPGIVAALGDVTDEQRDVLEEIERAGQTMLEQIELSLDLYKMETGTYTLVAQRVDLALIVTGVAEMLAPLARSKDVAVDVDVAGPVFALGNALLCQTITANLLKNALEAETSGSRVLLRLRETADRAVLSVANPAVVPADIAPVFFEKYTTSGKAGGSGLGAYSARLMTVSQKGEIRLETTPETGTIVTVSLPVR